LPSVSTEGVSRRARWNRRRRAGRQYNMTEIALHRLARFAILRIHAADCARAALLPLLRLRFATAMERNCRSPISINAIGICFISSFRSHQPQHSCKDAGSEHRRGLSLRRHSPVHLYRRRASRREFPVGARLPADRYAALFPSMTTRCRAVVAAVKRVIGS